MRLVQRLVAGAASADEESHSDFIPAGLTAAIEALLEFHFGDARPTLVAETQIALIAAKQLSPLSSEGVGKSSAAGQRKSDYDPL